MPAVHGLHGTDAEVAGRTDCTGFTTSGERLSTHPPGARRRDIVDGLRCAVANGIPACCACHGLS
jgi:hypothetical protein